MWDADCGPPCERRREDRRGAERIALLCGQACHVCGQPTSLHKGRNHQSRHKLHFWHEMVLYFAGDCRRCVRVSCIIVAVVVPRVIRRHTTPFYPGVDTPHFAPLPPKRFAGPCACEAALCERHTPGLAIVLGARPFDQTFDASLTTSDPLSSTAFNASTNQHLLLSIRQNLHTPLLACTPTHPTCLLWPFVAQLRGSNDTCEPRLPFD